MIKWLLSLPIILVLIIVSLTIYLQPNSFIGCSIRPVDGPTCNKADAIVVVSGGDTRARTEAGINLFHNGWADYLVLSGAAKDLNSPSNAAAMRSQALAAGVPIGAILIDEYAENTQQNAENAQTIFSKHNFKNVILVTSGYHQKRANLEFEKMAKGVEIRNYPVVNDKDWGWFWWLTPHGWWLAGGEFVKIIAFHFGISS